MTAGSAPARLRLLGNFRLDLASRTIEIPIAGQRVLSILALLGGTAHRSRVAGLLWADHPEERALSNLRSAVWRLPEGARDAVARHGASIALDPAIAIDLDEATTLARALLEHPTDVRDPVDRELLMHDVLPGLDEEWLVVPRERHRQRRLHALEALAQRDVDEGRPLDAVDTALAAVAAEPLRESAQLLVVRAHLAAGNRSAALEQYERFRTLLAAELDLAPSPQLVALAEQARGLPVTAP